MTELTLNHRSNIRRFHSKRADYYEHLAFLFQNGDTKPADIFRIDAQRYIGTPRGVLSALWDARYESGGADLRSTWEGCLPEAELLILALTSDGESDALPLALKSMARVARTADRVLVEARITLAVAAFAALLGLAGVLVLPIIAVAQFKEAMEVPVEFWGPPAASLLHWAQWVSSHWIGLGLGFVGLIAYLRWSIPNLTGRVRSWLDKHMLLYRTARDLQATRFLVLMAELTRPRGNNMQTLQVSLDTIRAGTRNAWLAWKIDAALERMQSDGGTTLDFLDVGLLPQEMFWYLRDMEEAQKDTSKAFLLTGAYIDSLLIPRFTAVLLKVRWMVLLGAVASLLGANFWVITAGSSMQKSAMNYYSSN
jgi:hypothetical protein